MRFGSRREVWLISLGLAAGAVFSHLGHNLLQSRKPPMIEEAECDEAMFFVIGHANTRILKERQECVDALELLKEWRFPEVPKWWDVAGGGKPL